MKFKHYQTKASFLTDLGDNKINNGDLCYIKDTQEIYTHGQYYRGCLSDYAQNDSQQPDYIKNRTHYVESVSTSSVWYQTGCNVGSGTTSPGGYPATFNITTGDKYNVTISQGSNSKTYEGLTAEYDSTFNGLALRKNWSNSMGMSDTSTDALLLVVQPSNVVLRSADIYGENCTVQVSEVTETIHKLDPKYLPDNVNQLESITTSKSGKVTTVTFEQTNGTETQFQVTDGADGTNGKSAYQVAVDNGYVGTEAQWLASLKGADGVSLGEIALTQTVTQDTDKVPSDKAVYDEVAYPDVVYEHIQDLPYGSSGFGYNRSGSFVYKQGNSNFCCCGPVDVRGYDTVAWKKFATANIAIVVLDENGLFITALNGVTYQSISRATYPNMGYIMLQTIKGNYTNNVQVDFTLSNSTHVKDELTLAKHELSQIKHGSVRVNYNLTMYQGDRLVDKTIVLFCDSNGGEMYALYGTVRLQYAAVNLFYVKNNSNTTLLQFHHGNRERLSIILTFDDEGNMKVYLSGVLKGTITYDKFPDTDWKLYLRYGGLYSHASLINANLDDYISIIENYGWEDWFPDASWVDSVGYTFEHANRTTAQPAITVPTAPFNSLLKVTATLTNNSSIDHYWYAQNMSFYPSENIPVPAGETVTATKLVNPKTTGCVGLFGKVNNSNYIADASGFSVGFLWGLDYRYSHDGGFFNLYKRTYQPALISLIEGELVPKILSSSAAGSAVGQIRVDANGNLQMFNGTTWKQINNS